MNGTKRGVFLIGVGFWLLAPCPSTFSQELPNADFFGAKLQQTLPSFWGLESVKIIRSAEVGTPETPIASVRFEALVAPDADLFIPTDKSISVVPLVLPSYLVDEERTLYGTARLEYHAGQWSGPITIENPVDSLGRPLDAYEQFVVPIGSDREKQIAALTASEAMVELKRDFENAFQEASTQYSAKLAKLEDDTKSLADKAESKLDAERLRLEKEHKEKVAQIREKYDADIASLMKTLAAEKARTKAAVEAQLVSLTEGIDIKLVKANEDKANAEALSKALDSLEATLQEIRAKNKRVGLLSASLRAAEVDSAKTLGGVWAANVVCESSYDSGYRDQRTTYTILVEFDEPSGLAVRGGALINGGSANRWLEDAKSSATLTLPDGLGSYPAAVTLALDDAFDHSGIHGFTGSISAKHIITGVGNRPNDKCSLNMNKLK